MIRNGIKCASSRAVDSFDYQRLFARIDFLVLSAAPGFEIVQRWRTQQEHALRARSSGGMSDAEIVRFIQHHERLTRRILVEMPGYANLAISLDESRILRMIAHRP